MNIIQKFSISNTTAAAGRKIQYIVIHYTAGTKSKTGSAVDSAAWFANPAAQASADFIVDDSTIVQFNAEPLNRYCWAVGGGNYGNKGGKLFGKAKNANCISIEICSNNRSGKITVPNDKNYYFTDAVVDRAVELTKYLMDKYGIPVDRVIRHYDVNGKPCPGIIGWNAESGDESKWKAFKARLTAKQPLKGSDLTESESERIAKVAPIYQQCQKDTGMLASVGLAQFCLESGFGTTDLAVNANNLHGMKCSLSGNTWSNSTWDGKSKYGKHSPEVTDGKTTMVYSYFRKYKSLKESIYDRAAYFIGAMTGGKHRYPNIAKMTDPEQQIKAIKAGGYATDPEYENKLLDIIRRYNLTKYDVSRGDYMFSVGVVQAGSNGNDVKLLQRLLKSNGFKGADGSTLKIDGDAGENTIFALTAYQKKNKLSADGVAGTDTWKKILMR